MMPAGAYEDILNSPSLTRLVLFQASGSENAAAGGGADLKQEAVPLSSSRYLWNNWRSRDPQLQVSPVRTSEVSLEGAINYLRVP